MSFGYNQSGDFDQLSLQGVDFGADYTKDYGIKPNNLKGDYSMYGYSQQMGVVPQGMGGYHDQMGSYHQQMGSHLHQMGIIPKGMAGLSDPLFTVQGVTVSKLHALLGLGAIGLVVMMKSGALDALKAKFA